MTNQNNEQETAALRLLAKFNEKYGDLSDAMRSINHWQYTLSEWRNLYSPSRVTDIDVETAEAEMLAAIRAHASALREKDAKLIAMLRNVLDKVGCGIQWYAENSDDADESDAEMLIEISDALQATQPTAEAFIAEIEVRAKIGLLRDMIEDAKQEEGTYWPDDLQRIIDLLEEDEKRKQAEQGAQNGNG